MEVRDTAVVRTAGFEGFVEHFYLDTKGEVTVGYGRMLSDADSAVALPMMVGGKEASDQAKREEWALVKSKPPGKTPAYYKKFTTMTIPMDEAKSLLRSNLVGSASDLEVRFSKIDDYPEQAQDALLDMMFNLGLSRFKREKWPKLFSAVEKQDWMTAAVESNRPDVQDARNEAIRDLFLSAAEELLVASVWSVAADRLFRQKMVEFQELVATGEAYSKFFPGGITNIRLRVNVGSAEIQLDISGPKRTGGRADQVE